MRVRGYADGNEQYGVRRCNRSQDAGAGFRWAFADFGMWNDLPGAARKVRSTRRRHSPPPVTSANGGANGSQILDHLTTVIYSSSARASVTTRVAGLSRWTAVQTGPGVGHRLYEDGKIIHPLALNKRRG
jgi:hypothetical protein